MATKRIKDISSTASSFDNDDYLAIDGATNGTRKMLASDLAGADLVINVNGTDYPIVSITKTVVSDVSGILVVYDDGSLDMASLFFADGVGLNYVKTQIENQILTYTLSISSNVITLTEDDANIFTLCGFKITANQTATNTANVINQARVLFDGTSKTWRAYWQFDGKTLQVKHEYANNNQYTLFWRNRPYIWMAY